MAYYCERGCERGAGYTFKFADGSTEGICSDCAEQEASELVLTAIRDGTVRSAEGARQLWIDTLNRYSNQ